ncbi:TPA: TerB family tellurite resistance protein, partial [Klebsiella aerogenes]
VRVGIAVGKSDGNFDPDEQAAAREIIAALGFSAEEFGL